MRSYTIKTLGVDKMSEPNQVAMNEKLDAAVLFKNWVRLTSDGTGIQTDFENFELKELEDDWYELDRPSYRVEVEAERNRLKKYAYGEFLGHHLAYQNLSTAPLQRVLEEDGSYKEYHCKRLVTDNEGLIGYVLVPTSVNEGETPDIKVIFKGTDPKSYASLARDKELCGAGSISFARNRYAIIEQINGILKEFNASYNAPIKLSLAGHSLGGADAQNCLNAVMEAMAQNIGLSDVDVNMPAQKRQYLQNIQELRLFTCNAAGIPQATEERMADLAAFIAEKRVAGQTSTQIKEFTLRVAGDGVQQTGQGHAFSNVPRAHAEVDVLKADLGYGNRAIFNPSTAIATTAAATLLAGAAGTVAAAAVIGSSTAWGAVDTFKAHTRHLCKQPIELRYQNMSNATPEGQKQVHAELSRKSWWLNKFHQTAGMLFGFEKHKEKTSKKAAVPAPVAVPLAAPVTEAPKSFWRRMLSPRFLASVAS